MKSKLLIKNDSQELIIFMSGWGCDDVQFQDMHSGKNVVIFWDYTDLEVDFDFSAYNKFYLVGYSAGVFVAGLLEAKLPKLERRVALNGNPNILDYHYGLEPNILNVFKNITLDNYMDFRRNYLCYSESDLEIFNKHACIRTIESCNNELDALAGFAKVPDYPRMEYDTVYLSDSDRIFKPQFQLEYYRLVKNTKIITIPKANHNVFYSRIKSFDDFFGDGSWVNLE